MEDGKEKIVDDQRGSNESKLVGGITGKGFMPGKSGNPGGRPKGRTILSEIHRILDDEKELESVAKAYVDGMKSGSFQHLKEIIDREDGKVPDRIANSDGTNITITVTRIASDKLRDSTE